MNWQLVTGLIFSLNAFIVGVLAQTQAGLTSASVQNVGVSDPSVLIPVDFVIYTSTVGNWETIFVAGEPIDIGGATAGSIDVPMPTEDEPIVYVRLSKADASKGGGGEDVLVLGEYARVQRRKHC